MRTHNKVDTQDRFEPTLIGRAGLDPWCLNLQDHPLLKEQSRKIPENKSSKITGSFPQKRNQLMLQWLKCKNNYTFRFIIITSMKTYYVFLFTVLVPKIPFLVSNKISIKRMASKGTVPCQWSFWRNGVLSRKGRIDTRWFKVTYWSPSWRSLSHSKGHLTIPKRSQRIARYKLYCQHFHHGGNIITLPLPPGTLATKARIPGILSPLQHRLDSRPWCARTLVRFCPFLPDALETHLCQFLLHKFDVFWFGIILITFLHVGINVQSWSTESAVISSTRPGRTLRCT